MRSIADYILTHFFMWKKFDAKKKFKITKRIIEGKEKKAIFFYPYWTGKSNLYDKLAKNFQDYTLVFYDYPKEIMSEDVKVSLKYMNELLDDSLSLIKQFRKDGYKEIILIGSSSGSNFALKLATMTKVEKVVLNMIDKNEAETIFKSSALRRLKEKLSKHHLTLHKADRVYKFISPEYIVSKIKNKEIKILLFLSKSDIFCTADEFNPVLKQLDRNKISYKLRINRFLGHILGMYKNIHSKEIVDFVRG